MINSASSVYANSLLRLAQDAVYRLPKPSPEQVSLDIEQPLHPQLRSLIQYLQDNKYPNPPYACHSFLVQLNHHTVPVTYVSSEGTVMLTDEQRKSIAAHALLVRELTLADSLAKYAASHLATQQSIAINLAIKKLIQDEIPSILYVSGQDPLDAYARTNEFIAKLASILMDNSGLTRAKAINLIKRYERYVVSELNTKQVIINESTFDGHSIIQMDIPLKGTLTDSQKLEYLRIFNHRDKPAWFSALAKEEQEWYKERVPQDFADQQAWDSFAAINKTSAMQQGLENKNARQHYLFLDQQLIAESTKVATLNPIEAKKSDQQRLTELNAEQLAEYLLQTASSDFSKHWGIPLNDNKSTLKPMLFIHSLLSPLPGNLADSKMINSQRAALDIMKQKYSKQCQLIHGNDAVNMLRRFDNQTSNWQHTDQLISYAKYLLLNLPHSRLSPALLEASITNSNSIKSDAIPNFVYFGSSASQFQGQKKNIKLMVAAIAELEKLRTTPEMTDRNKAAFKSAYQGLLVEAAGGKISSNCKSGKDRTGLDEIYRNTMRVYFEQYGRLPSYSDNKIERHNFIKFFQHFYNTLKIHEAAASNTPGSFGIKDSAKMLCRDIAKIIGKDYHASNKRANINKTNESLLQKLKYDAVTFFKNGIRFLSNTVNKALNAALNMIGMPIQQKIAPTIQLGLQRDENSISRIYFDWKQKEKNYLLEKHYHKGTFDSLEKSILDYDNTEPMLDALINIRYELGSLFQQANFHPDETPHLAGLHLLYAKVNTKVKQLEQSKSTVNTTIETEQQTANIKNKHHQTHAFRCATEVEQVSEEESTARLITGR